MWGSGVDEVDSEPVDLRAELWPRVKPAFRSPPVVSRGPVAADLLEVGEWHPLRPVIDRLRVGPSGAPQPFAQVNQFAVGNVHSKRYDVSHPITVRSPRETP